MASVQKFVTSGFFTRAAPVTLEGMLQQIYYVAAYGLTLGNPPPSYQGQGSLIGVHLTAIHQEKIRSR